VLKLQYESSANLNKFTSPEMPKEIKNHYESFKKTASLAREELREREVQSIHRDFIQGSRRYESNHREDNGERSKNQFSFTEYKERVLN
jgi:hypothetical protein